MPESRDRLVRKESALEDLTSLKELKDSALRRSFISGSTLADRRRRISSHGRDLFGVLKDNKENFRPEGSTLSRYRRSPLPAWYPRTPLRDITHIVKALEMQRRKASLQRQNEEGGTSSPAPLLTLTATPEHGVAHQVEATPISSVAVVVSPIPAGQFEIYVDAESPANNPAINDLTVAASRIALGKKCLNTVSRMERVVSRNLISREENPVKMIQRSTLMMMR